MPSKRVQRRIDRLLDQVEEAIESREWDAAQEFCRATLALDGDNEDAQALLRAAQEARGGDGPAQEATDSRSPTAPVRTEPTSDQPASFDNGRYKVTGFLGEGGKKKVYLVHDITLDRDVAFALIKAEGLDDASRQRITREAQAMARLGDNPNIMPIFDLGEENGQPYMVGPLMGGGDVEALIEDAENGRLSLEVALRITSEVCHGLEFAHSKGIIHRDLKPGNVWLTDDGTVRIGDFGLAISLDQSRLTQEKMMVGTVSYMPPEQATGGEITPKADLYSLGAMLYEMVTGRPPFLGDDEIAIISQHVNTPPVAPAWHNSAVPAQLDSLIIRLLAKDPSERPESAADVLTAIGEIDLSVTAERDEDAESGSLDSMAGGVFVGRQREMDQLKAALEDALSGHGRLVTLLGEPGIGKTRTSMELATYAGLRRAQVLWGRSYEEGGVPPYWSWVQAIRSYVNERDPDMLRSEMGSTASVISEIVSEVKARLPEVQAPPPLDSPEAARFRLFDSVTTFLKSASREQPLVIILDDLHWADRPSLMLLEFVARELAGSRLLVIGTYRDIELTRRHPLSQTLAELTREGLFDRIILRGLSREDVGRFIEVAAGVQPPAELVEAVHTQTEGNPLFVTETVRLLVQEGGLASDGGEPSGDDAERAWAVRIPVSVREVIGRRLDRLSERCNETLVVASVVGRRFGLDQLDAIIEDASQDRLIEVLEEALAARVIEELPDRVGRYQFTHAVIQETLADELSTTRRVMLHARIGDVLEELYGERAETYSAELAYHYGEAEAMVGSEKLIRYSLLAGEEALSRYAYEDALVPLERAYAAKGAETVDAEAARILSALGQAQAATLGEEQRGVAEESLRKAFEFYVESRDVAGAIAVAGQQVMNLSASVEPFPLMLRGADANAGNPIERALELVEPDSLEAAQLLYHDGTVIYQLTGDMASATESFTKALDIARRESDYRLEIQILGFLAQVDYNRAQLDECMEKCRRILELTPAANEPRSEFRARYFTMEVLRQRGELQQAHERVPGLIQLAESMHDRAALTTALRLGQLLAYHVGDWEGCRELGERGLDLDPAALFPLRYQAFLEFESGNLDTAVDLYKRVLSAYEAAGGDQGPTAPMVTALLATLARTTGSPQYLDAAERLGNAVLAHRQTVPDNHRRALICSAIVAVLRGDRARAADLYPQMIEAGIGERPPWFEICGFRALALIADFIGNGDEAIPHIERALEYCRGVGFRPELAWTCCDYSEMLLERNAPGDREKATELQDEAIAIAQELGMRTLLERVLAQREILKA